LVAKLEALNLDLDA